MKTIQFSKFNEYNKNDLNFKEFNPKSELYYVYLLPNSTIQLKK